MKRTMLVDVRLEPNKGDRVQVMPLGDVHLGAETCDVNLFKANVQNCLDRGVYVVGMGDYLETATLGSVGDIFGQNPSPQGQFDEMLEILTPLVEKGLLIGLHDGNYKWFPLSVRIGKKLFKLLE